MFKKLVLKLLLLTPIFLCLSYADAEAQFGNLDEQGIIRIAIPGQLADTLSVWGDVRTPGRYLVPRGAPVAKVLQYAGGPTGSRIGGGQNVWAKSRISISISQFEPQSSQINFHQFNMRYNDEIPLDLRTYSLNNDDIILVEVRQVPGFLDVLGVVGPILGTITTTYLFYDRFLR